MVGAETKLCTRIVTGELSDSLYFEANYYEVLLGCDTYVAFWTSSAKAACSEWSPLEVEIIKNDKAEECPLTSLPRKKVIRSFWDPQQSLNRGLRGSGVKFSLKTIWSWLNTGTECDLVHARYRGMDPRWPLQGGFCNSVAQDDDKLLLCLGERGATEAVSYEPATSRETCLLVYNPLIKSQRHTLDFGLQVQMVC